MPFPVPALGFSPKKHQSEAWEGGKSHACNLLAFAAPKRGGSRLGNTCEKLVLSFHLPPEVYGVSTCRYKGDS